MKYYAEERFIFVYQDVRGRNGSEGEFVHVRPHLPVKSAPADIDESSDTYDSIDWLLKNVPNHNGSAGLMGISYPGFYSAAGMIDAHPALKCVSPQAPVTDWFIGDDFHHNGAFYLAAQSALGCSSSSPPDLLREHRKRPVPERSAPDQRRGTTQYLYSQIFADCGGTFQTGRTEARTEVRASSGSRLHPVHPCGPSLVGARPR